MFFVLTNVDILLHHFADMSTCLEDLPNELLLQIFNSLELNKLWQAFSSLNYRFDYLLSDICLRFYARFPSPPSPLLQKYYSQIVGFSLINWNPNDVFTLLHPSPPPRLVSLSIESTSSQFFGRISNDLVQRILSLSNLRVCRLKLASTLNLYSDQLSISQSIRHLTLGMISLNVLLELLPHIPNLCSLEMWLDYNGRKFNYNKLNERYCWNKLKQFILGIHNDIDFDQVLFLIHCMPRLYSFQLYGSVWDNEYLNSSKWKKLLLGEENYPLLKKTKIKLDIRFINVTPNVEEIRWNHVQPILNNFNQFIFRTNNFQIIFDGSYWFYLTCEQNR